MIKKELLFTRYVADLQNTLSKYSLKITSKGYIGGQEYYLCPIALTLHARDDIKTGQLTIDHVPPKSLGGKPLILTNKEINNTDGQSSDKKLLNYFTGCNFQSHGRPLRTKVSSKDIDLQGLNSQFSLIKENDGYKDSI